MTTPNRSTGFLVVAGAALLTLVLAFMTNLTGPRKSSSLFGALAEGTNLFTVASPKGWLAGLLVVPDEGSRMDSRRIMVRIAVQGKTVLENSFTLHELKETNWLNRPSYRIPVRESDLKGISLRQLGDRKLLTIELILNGSSPWNGSVWARFVDDRFLKLP